MESLRIVLIGFVLMQCAAGRANAGLPVPPPAELNAALADIRAKPPAPTAGREEKLAFAATLVQTAREANRPPAQRLAMLLEARDIAAREVEWPIAMAAVDWSTHLFDLDVVKFESESLADMGKKIDDRAGRTFLTQNYLVLAEKALDRGDVRSAGQSLESAISALPTDMAVAGSPNFLPDLLTDVNAAQLDFDNFIAARQFLAGDPTDADANLAVGKFVCFVMNDWTRGLHFLAKGSDELLRKAAELDLRGAQTAAQNDLLGDTWFNIGDQQTGMIRRRAYGRALGWYQRTGMNLAPARRERFKLSSLARPFGNGSNRIAIEPGGIACLEGVLSALPDRLRSLPGNTVKAADITTWLTQFIQTVSVDADLEISQITHDENGATIYSDVIGPVFMDGVRYEILFRVATQDPTKLALLSRSLKGGRRGAHSRRDLHRRGADADASPGAGRAIPNDIEVQRRTMAPRTAPPRNPARRTPGARSSFPTMTSARRRRNVC